MTKLTSMYWEQQRVQASIELQGNDLHVARMHTFVLSAPYSCMAELTTSAMMMQVTVQLDAGCPTTLPAGKTAGGSGVPFACALPV